MAYIAVGDVDTGGNKVNTIEDLRQMFSNRPVWMAASIHRGEEEGNHSGNLLLLHGLKNCGALSKLKV